MKVYRKVTDKKFFQEIMCLDKVINSKIFGFQMTT